MAEAVNKIKLRDEAERFLSLHGASFDMFDSSGSNGLRLDELDAKKMVHELKVQQIELEMQNAMLAQALAEADELRLKYTELYQRAPVAYLTLLPNGDIVESNQCAQEMLSKTSSPLLKNSFWSYVAPDCLAAVKLFIQNALGTSPVSMPVFSAKGDLALTLQTDRLMPVYVRAQARAFVDRLGAGTLIHLVLTDVTSLHLAVNDVVQSITQPP